MGGYSQMQHHEIAALENVLLMSRHPIRARLYAALSQLSTTHWATHNLLLACEAPTLLLAASLLLGYGVKGGGGGVSPTA